MEHNKMEFKKTLIRQSVDNDSSYAMVFEVPSHIDPNDVCITTSFTLSEGPPIELNVTNNT
jgi:hypothetical protein